MLFDNPELRRHVWLDLTPHRLVMMPVLLGLVFLLTVAGESPNRNGLALVALGAFVLISLFWGGSLASASIVNEMRDHTWDTQRMSALTPFELTLGKVLGANLFTWYGGLICLVVYAFEAGSLSMTTPVWQVLALAVGSALFVHAFVTLLALLLVRSRHSTRSLGLLSVLMLLYLVGPLLLLEGRHQQVVWYGIEFTRLGFVLGSVWFFALWAGVGAWRVMAQMLQVRTTPLFWLLFAVSLTGYLYGLLWGFPVRSVDVGQLFWLVAFLVLLALSYLSVWAEPKDVVSIRRVQWAARQREWRRLFENLPLWVATGVPALLCVPVLALFPPGSLGPNEPVIPALAALGLLLFAVRDLALIYLCSLGRTPGRAHATALFYLFLLYGLLPWLFDAADLELLLRLLLPPVLTQPLQGVALVAVQAAAMGGLLWLRWRRQR